MKGTKAKKKTTSVWMILPLYFFTLVFVAGPLIYMVALSFAQPGSGTSVEWNLTLENYRKILDPVYLQTFRESFQLALTSTVIICILGYPFGYFMAKMSDTWKKRAMLLLKVLYKDHPANSLDPELLSKSTSSYSNKCAEYGLHPVEL